MSHAQGSSSPSDEPVDAPPAPAAADDAGEPYAVDTAQGNDSTGAAAVAAAVEADEVPLPSPAEVQRWSPETPPLSPGTDAAAPAEPSSCTTAAAAAGAEEAAADAEKSLPPMLSVEDISPVDIGREEADIMRALIFDPVPPDTATLQRVEEQARRSHDSTPPNQSSGSSAGGSTPVHEGSSAATSPTAAATAAAIATTPKSSAPGLSHRGHGKKDASAAVLSGASSGLGSSGKRKVVLTKDRTAKKDTELSRRQRSATEDDRHSRETEEELPEEEAEKIKRHSFLIRQPLSSAHSGSSSNSSGSSSSGSGRPTASAKSGKTAKSAALSMSSSTGSRGAGGGSGVKAPPTPTRSAHTDPALETVRKKSSAGATPRTGASSALHAPAPKSLWEATAAIARIAEFAGLRTWCQLMRVNRQCHMTATSDALWRPFTLDAMNLQPLAASACVTENYYRFFIDSIVTTKALHGHYTYVSAAQQQQGGRGTSPPSSSSSASASAAALGGAMDDIFSLDAVTLLISAASFGQSNHSVGRVQLLIRYRNESMEVLQGSCRFSAYRRCYSFCCNSFSSQVRGPVFTVAVAQVHKPWPCESPQHFAMHKGGVRLVMTPTLWEGQSVGSQVSETDVIAVSKVPVPSSKASSPRQRKAL